MKIIVKTQFDGVHRKIQEVRRIGRIHSFIANLASYYGLSMSDGIELNSRSNTWTITNTNADFLLRLQKELIRFPTVSIEN